MKNERVLHGDDSTLLRDSVKFIIEKYGAEDGHKLVGSAASVSEVERLLKEGLRPTVALVDNRFPNDGDGERAAGIIRLLSPETIIVSFSTTDGLKWGDYNLNKGLKSREIIQFLTDLKH